MSPFDPPALPPRTATLAQQVAALQAKAQKMAADGPSPDSHTPDFKQIATELGTPAAGPVADRAAAELAQSLGAQRRPADSLLAVCHACGKPVNRGPFMGASDRVLCASCQTGATR